MRLLLGLGLSVVISTFELWMMYRFGYGPRGVGHVLAATGVATAMINVMLVPRLVRAASERRLLVAAIAILAAGRCAQALACAVSSLLLAQLLVAVGGGVSSTLLASLTASESPSDKVGYLLGCSESIEGLAHVVGPLLSGLLFDRLGPSAPAAAGSAFCVAALATALGSLGCAGRGSGGARAVPSSINPPGTGRLAVDRLKADPDSS